MPIFPTERITLLGSSLIGSGTAKRITLLGSLKGGFLKNEAENLLLEPQKRPNLSKGYHRSKIPNGVLGDFQLSC